MADTVGVKAHNHIAWTRVWQIAAVLAAAPFLAGAMSLWWKLALLPDTAGHLAKAQVLGAALFSFGTALGIPGAVLTLTSRAAHRRVLCTALTLFGISHIMFGFYVRYAIEAAATSSRPPALPLIAPVALWAYSALLAFRAPRLAAAQEPKAEEDVSVEQPPLLSRP